MAGFPGGDGALLDEEDQIARLVQVEILLGIEALLELLEGHVRVDGAALLTHGLFDLCPHHFADTGVHLGGLSLDEPFVVLLAVKDAQQEGQGNDRAGTLAGQGEGVGGHYADDAFAHGRHLVDLDGEVIAAQVGHLVGDVHLHLTLRRVMAGADHRAVEIQRIAGFVLVDVVDGLGDGIIARELGVGEAVDIAGVAFGGAFRPGVQAGQVIRRDEGRFRQAAQGQQRQRDKQDHQSEHGYTSFSRYSGRSARACRCTRRKHRSRCCSIRRPSRWSWSGSPAAPGGSYRRRSNT